MSQYNSEKYMAYKGLIKDSKGKGKERRCPHCGYDLRAHKLGDLCPECGQPILYKPIGNEFSKSPLKYTRMLSCGAWLIIFAWYCLMFVWIMAYFGSISNFVLIINIIGGIAAVIASRFITVKKFEAYTITAKARNAAQWVTIVAVVAFILSLVITYRNYGGLSGGTGFDNFITALISFLWLIYQALICYIAMQIADDAEHASLAHTFWNLIFALGIVGPFAAAFLSAAWVMMNSRGSAPTCCLGGYFFVIGFIIAEIWFLVAIWRLTLILSWTRKYQDFEYSRDKRIRDQIKNKNN